MTESKTLAPSSIGKFPEHLNFHELESKWADHWEKIQTYSFRLSDTGPVYAIDTPPPTVSGSLHVGHIFSYTHTDVLARHRRMLGQNVFYPMGWDDNGLPTERRVQNFYNVRCSPNEPYIEYLEPQTNAAKEPKILSRSNFIEFCLALTKQDEIAFKNLWRRIGLSVDWNYEYSTIDKKSQRTAQASFVELLTKGQVYNLEAPTMWDVDFQTAVAQAETEERTIKGEFFRVRFKIEQSKETFIIATTRPELLPACVGVTAHPDDDRYKHLFGETAITPLFGVPVPIFPSELVNPEKGTGIVMVCTFGDINDVSWWREFSLPLRQILGVNGRLRELTFGTKEYPSIEQGLANHLYSGLAGMSVKSAQQAIVSMLAGDNPKPHLVGEPQEMEHSVKFWEKGDRPLEFMTSRQWFVRLLDKKPQLLQKGEEISWYPDFMRLRYKNWTENLQSDWCISPQRYFGVPFPVWYPLNDVGEPTFENPLVAELEALPVDPTSQAPKGFSENQRSKPKGFVAEADVFDTWFTSSMTPQIVSDWAYQSALTERICPMDLRPQSHEIIRTWAFYTIAKSLLHDNAVPWKNVAISGWVLDPDRKKMSKSVGNVLTPTKFIDQYGADAVRYWAASARLGTDTAFDENVLKIGKRLSGKLVLSNSPSEDRVTNELDRAFVGKLRQLIARVTAHFGKFEFALALSETERFFWNYFTDSYLELTKIRSRQVEKPELQGSAVLAMRRGFSVMLRLFAPFLPYITEEIWSWDFAIESGHATIHRAPWPTISELEKVELPQNESSFDIAIACLNAINKRKTEAGVSLAKPVNSIKLSLNQSAKTALVKVFSDVAATAKIQSWEFLDDDLLDDETVRVLKSEF